MAKTIDFRDNENFYGKNNEVNLTVVLSPDLTYDKDVTQNEIEIILRTMQLASLVQFSTRVIN